MGIKIHLNNVRISFAHGIFQPNRPKTGEGDPKYGADFILEPDSAVVEVLPDGKKVIASLRELEVRVATDAWKTNGKRVLESLEPSKRAIREGNRRTNAAGEPYEGYADRVYVAAKSKVRPLVVDRRGQPLTEDDGVIYSGCYVNAIVELYAVTDPSKRGVFAALKGVQFVRDGDAFGGGTPARADEFDVLDEAPDASFDV